MRLRSVFLSEKRSRVPTMAATTVAMPSNGSHSQNLRPELKRENIITASNQIERLKFDEKKESKDCRWSQHTHTKNLIERGNHP